MLEMYERRAGEHVSSNSVKAREYTKRSSYELFRPHTVEDIHRVLPVITYTMLA